MVDRRASTTPVPDANGSNVHPLRTLALTTAAVVLVAACGSGDDRPGVAEWRPRWEAARALVPEAATLVDGGEDVCGAALGELRAEREELVNSPRPVLDDSVGDWVAEVEGLLLECPDDEDEVAERLEQIEVLAAAVMAGLRAAETS